MLQLIMLREPTTTLSTFLHNMQRRESERGDSMDMLFNGIDDMLFNGEILLLSKIEERLGQRHRSVHRNYLFYSVLGFSLQDCAQQKVFCVKDLAQFVHDLSPLAKDLNFDSTSFQHIQIWAVGSTKGKQI